MQAGYYVSTAVYKENIAWMIVMVSIIASAYLITILLIVLILCIELELQKLMILVPITSLLQKKACPKL